MIPVTKPFLPPLSDYQRYLDGIWNRNYLTNNGPLVNELEIRLKRYFDIKHLLFLGNGTIALQIAIKALHLSGEIITTPFSYVATTSALVWEGCIPVFVDINPNTLNIDVEKIENAITPRTSGILATHVFGNACDIEKIDFIAKKHNLKVIYDAAHTFGSKYKGKSLYSYGDISTTSFHSTKLFHTVEGGGVFTTDPELLKALAYLRNFGHDGPENFNGVGINGKNSEFHAAMGLCNLDYISQILQRRREQSANYDDILKELRVTRQSLQHGCEYNYAYYPIIFDTEAKALKAREALIQKEIFPRRYFYPSLSTLNYVKEVPTPISNSIASRILCLPLYHELSKEEQLMIGRVLLRTQNY